MTVELPAFGREAFVEALGALSPRPLPEAAGEALYQHYRTLRRWARRQALIGPGGSPSVVERHYGESLAALALLAVGEQGSLVDVGSGAGFPGLVLAAACPGLQVTLVEARQRKWAFLQAAARAGALKCRCLNARVGNPPPAGLPEGIPRRVRVVTARALKLDGKLLASLAELLEPGGRILLWLGREPPALPPSLASGREVPLAGSESRRILELLPRPEVIDPPTRS